MDISLEDKLKAEQVRLLYNQSPFLVIAILSIAAVVVGYFWNDVPRLTLYIWMGCQLALMIARVALATRFKRTDVKPENAVKWGNAFAITSGISGILWGSIAFIMLRPDSVESIVLICFVLAGNTSGSLMALSSYIPAYYAYTITSLTPLTIVMGTIDQPFGKVSALALLMLIAVSLAFSFVFNRHLRETFRLRFENLELVENLRAQKQVAEKASEDKSRFLAAASHDLRQPHQALGLFIESLDHLETDREKRSILDKTKQAFQAMSGLLDQLLDISRLDAKTTRPELHSIALQPFLHRITMAHMGAAEQKELELRLRPTPAIVYTDPGMLHRILSNLLTNAIRYTDEGGILLGVRRVGPNWRILVCDTGRGIPEKDRESIFEEFTQLANPERDREKGLGLGLAIVRRLAALLDSEITLQSNPGRGSCFSILLPAAETSSPITEETNDVDNTLDLGALEIAIIDDDQIARDSMATLLKVWNCRQVHAFGSVEACIREMEDSSWQPDALIVDYRLREGSTGVDAIKAVCELLDHDIPALIVTGDTAPERIEEAEASGYPLLHKPVDPNQLRDFLSNLNVEGDAD